MTPRSLLEPDTPILIVEDNHQYAKVLKLMLKGNLGYQDVTWVDGIQEALNLFAQGEPRFRILFIDYHFPDGRTGGELIEHLGKTGKTAEIATFLITAEPDLQNFKQAVSSGVSGVVAKPFDAAEIRRQIEKAQRARKLTQEDSF